MWKRSPGDLVTDELGTLTYDGICWRGQPDGSVVPIVLWSGRSGPDDRMVRVAASAVARLPEFETSARRYLGGLSLPDTRMGKLSSLAVRRPDPEWVRRVLAPRNQPSADAILSGEPTVTLEFEMVGERNVLDVTFVGDTPVDSDAH